MKNPSQSLLRLYDILEYLVDYRVGIVRYVIEMHRESGSPDFFHFYAEGCNTLAFGQQANYRTTGGVSTDRGIAMAKAVGEAVERYCAALYDVEEFPICSYDCAPFLCVPPLKFALYSHDQYERPGFPFVPFENATPVRWTLALDPLTDHIWYVPAAMVFIPYLYNQGAGERPIVQSISTGLACHCSLAEAAIAAICEVIERDAFTITWQAQLGMPQIWIDTLSRPNYELVMRFERAGYSVTLLNITMDVGVPTILAVSRSASPEAPALTFAASAALDPEQAVRKSLEELEHTRFFCQKIKTHLPRLAPDPDHENVVDQHSHLNYWSDHVNAPLADFVFSSNDRVEFDEIENLAVDSPRWDLEILLHKVRAVGYQALISDLTTPDVRELGLTVVRAVIPGFHPLFVGHGNRALGGSRLWEVPQKLGYQGITRQSGDNSSPHPYP